MSDDQILEFAEPEVQNVLGVGGAMNAAAGDHSPVFYQGDGLHTPGAVVPQNLLAGPGTDAPGQADGAGALLFIFGTEPAGNSVDLATADDFLFLTPQRPVVRPLTQRRRHIDER